MNVALLLPLCSHGEIRRGVNCSFKALLKALHKKRQMLIMIENDSTGLLCEEAIMKPSFQPEATVRCSQVLTNMVDVVCNEN